MNERQITPDITIAGQPSSEDIATLRGQGFRTVINLRTPGEQGALDEEERLVEAAGLNYSEIAMSPQTLDDIAVQRFGQAIASDNGAPALVHCGSGGRAGIISLMHLAVTQGWSLQRALEEGKKQNIAPGADSPYRPFFEDYIRRHSAGER